MSMRVLYSGKERNCPFLQFQLFTYFIFKVVVYRKFVLIHLVFFCKKRHIKAVLIKNNEVGKGLVDFYMLLF